MPLRTRVFAGGYLALFALEMLIPALLSPSSPCVARRGQSGERTCGGLREARHSPGGERSALPGPCTHAGRCHSGTTGRAWGCLGRLQPHGEQRYRKQLCSALGSMPAAGTRSSALRGRREKERKRHLSFSVLRAQRERRIWIKISFLHVSSLRLLVNERSPRYTLSWVCALAWGTGPPGDAQGRLRALWARLPGQGLCSHGYLLGLTTTMCSPPSMHGATPVPGNWAKCLSPKQGCNLLHKFCSLGQPRTALLSLQLLLCIFTFAMVLVPEAKDESRAAKGRRRGPSRLPMAAPALARAPDDPYTPMEDYERSIQDMVHQLKNGSEPGDTKCQVNLRLWRSNRRSLSPWAYSINHDATRIPADIPEARCLCTGCINPFTMQEDRTMASIPIYSWLPVRRLLCQAPGEVGHKAARRKKCHKKYQMVMETIAVGCTCIF
ncbi:interleukin-17B isoform X1 [Meleagris gallopavo]|uniref:Interleukin 17B n=1 Tax=Meleagris gallopavo TaxID=9103 RepID=A0A803XQS8_MELGA|nr:interleukin-17B isoform X1 [Meleagris gallopavo]